MPARLPLEVQSLLSAASQADRDTAWDAFVASHARLMLFAARAVTHDHDEAMDAYAWTLERLREDESVRLRGFSDGKGALFSTWLTVVVRRICVDYVRHARGRTAKSASGDLPEWRAVRRRLVELIGEPVPLENVRDEGSGADEMLEQRERHDVLEATLLALPPADRLLLALRFEDGRPASEIARAMRFPTQFHVYRRLDVVLGVLRRRLRAAGMDGPSG
ncbi:MAG TPA: sigma-70 family RNA polymerase sigma factor [Gemmatimonadales bacterium]|nr:sigma-70 family RNA polymerase sigma factor [Gemmatimonadales bacterium]